MNHVIALDFVVLGFHYSNNTMPELTPEDKIKLAVSFIEQSPPGEVK